MQENKKNLQGKSKTEELASWQFFSYTATKKDVTRSSFSLLQNKVICYRDGLEKITSATILKGNNCFDDDDGTSICKCGLFISGKSAFLLVITGLEN